ncbi:MAG: hypothetical protein HY978_04870 [Candidatus Liptonbacteria bacterium]|nr:hypothetical protein [Candidatus Liptonbacteria bacterium]
MGAPGKAGVEQPTSRIIDRRPHVVSEQSEEYREYREIQKCVREWIAPVFGEDALREMEMNRRHLAEMQGKIEHGEVFAFMSKAEHLESERIRHEQSNSEIINRCREAIRVALQDPNHFHNTQIIFREALEDPQLKAHFDSISQNARFTPAWEAMLVFFKGRVPKSFQENLWQLELWHRLKPIRDKYKAETDRIYEEIKAARPAGDVNLSQKLLKEHRAARAEEETAMQEEERAARADFDREVAILESEYGHKYSNYEMPNALFERMLEIHVGRFRKVAGEFEPEAARLMQSFREKITEEISNGRLPLDPQLVDRRIAELRVVLWDPMLKQDSASGDFDPYSAQITIRADQSPTDRTRNFYHEMRHALSGRILVSEMRKDRRAFIYRKIGLSFTRTVSMRPRDPVLDLNLQKEVFPVGEVMDRDLVLGWLNEAYTELQAIEDSGEKDSTSYIEFRYMFDAMREQGVDIDLLRAAYYENDDPDMPIEHRKSAWRAFSKNLQKVYPGVVGSAKLSDMVRGVRMLLTVENEPDFSRRLDLLKKKI